MRPSIGVTWRRRRQRSMILREAVDSVRARSHEMSQDRVREMLADELRKRGLNPPASEFALDVMAKTILTGEDHISRLKLGAEVGRDLLSRHSGARNLLVGRPQASGLNLFVQNAIILESDRSQMPLQVQLDQEAVQEWQRLAADATVRFLPGTRELFVLLSHDTAVGNGNAVFISIGDNYRVGTLGKTDGSLFDNALRDGIAQKRPVVAEAIQEVRADGSWSLHVYRPDHG
jgi:hypothetical protein